MAIIEWDGSLEVGHPEVDHQHQHLVGLINKLHESKLEGADLTTIRRVLMELYSYTVTHFHTEEALMGALEPSLKEAHMKEHEEFIAALDRLAAKTTEGDEFVGAEVFQWLVGWLLDHISVTDKQLVSCLPQDTSGTP